MAFILGITGGLGSGKSTAAKCLLTDATHIIEVDELARLFTHPGSRVYDALIERFGRQICNIDGSINRKGLARIAFSTQSTIAALNGIFKEPLTNAIKIDIVVGRSKHAKLIIIVAAILFEQGWDELCNGVLNISAPESLRVERLLRKGFTECDIQRRMASQLSERQRMKRAQWTLYTQPTIDVLCGKLRDLARKNKWL